MPAKIRVESLIDSGTESEAELIEADQALSVAFRDLLQSNLVSGQQAVRRLNYLLRLIRENQPGNQLIGCSPSLTQKISELQSAIVQFLVGERTLRRNHRRGLGLRSHLGDESLMQQLI